MKKLIVILIAFMAFSFTVCNSQSGSVNKTKFSSLSTSEKNFYIALKWLQKNGYGNALTYVGNEPYWTKITAFQEQALRGGYMNNNGIYIKIQVELNLTKDYANTKEELAWPSYGVFYTIKKDGFHLGECKTCESFSNKMKEDYEIFMTNATEKWNQDLKENELWLEELLKSLPAPKPPEAPFVPKNKYDTKK